MSLMNEKSFVRLRPAYPISAASLNAFLFYGFLKRGPFCFKASGGDVMVDAPGGATTLSMVTLSITTLSIMVLIIATLSITQGIMTIGIMTLGIQHSA